jgi:hypothetical protein
MFVPWCSVRHKNSICLYYRVILPAGISVCDVVTLLLKRHKIGADYLYCHGDSRLKPIERILYDLCRVQVVMAGQGRNACM